MSISTISKLNNYIYLGSYYPVYRNTKEFQELKIDVIINCAEEIVYPASNKYIIEHFPIEKNKNASMILYLETIYKKINDYLKNNKRIYVHCSDGLSRAPAVIIYYLMRDKKLTFNKAYMLIKLIRPSIKIYFNLILELKMLD